MKVITIGRGPDNDVVIDDLRVTRHHLQIVQNNKGEYSAVDLNSANGTFVNGEKISGEVRLQPNDVIVIGTTTLAWQDLINRSDDKETATKPKSFRKIWIWGLVCAIIIAAGAVGVYLYSSRSTEPQKEISNEDENQTSDLPKSTSAQATYNNYDYDLNNALREARDLNEQKAVDANNRAKEAEKAQTAAIQDKENAIRQITETIESKDKTIDELREEKEQLMRDKDAVEQNKQAEIQRKENEIQRKENEIETLKHQTQLKETFYALLTTMTDDKAYKACEKLDPTHTPSDKNKIRAKSTLMSLFNHGDDSDKQKIINTLNEIN